MARRVGTIKGCRSNCRCRRDPHRCRRDPHFCAPGTTFVCRNAKVGKSWRSRLQRHVVPKLCRSTVIRICLGSLSLIWGHFTNLRRQGGDLVCRDEDPVCICGQIAADELGTFPYFPTTFSHSFLSSSVPSRQFPASIHWRQGERF